MLSERQRGRLLVVAGVAFIALYFGVTAAIAPGVTTNGTAGDSTLVSTMGAGYDGEVVRLDQQGRQQWSHSGAISYNDVTRLQDGRLLVTYQIETTDCGQYESPCGQTGVRIYSRDRQTVVWNWTLTTRTILNSEIHDAQYLPERGEVLVADMDRERLVAINTTTNDVTWQWNASSHYTPPEDATKRDWLHINDVDPIGDGRYLVSVRNANQLVVVKRGQGVTEVINRDQRDDNDGSCRGLSDNQLVGEEIQCGSPEVLDHQHNPQWLEDGAVLVADSENDRAVELHRQPNGTWTVAWALYGAGGIPFDWPRDADRLENGHTLVTDTRNDRVVEVTRKGDVVWTALVPDEGYDADRGGREYPSGDAYPPSKTAEGRLQQPIEPLNTAYGALNWKFDLPTWIRAWHLLVIVVGANFAGAGGLIWWRA